MTPHAIEIASGFPLRAVLHARLTGERQSRIAASTPAAAYLALTPSTTFLLRAQNREVGAKCAALVAGLSAYAFEIGTDADAAVAELSSFMLARTSHASSGVRHCTGLEHGAISA